MIGAVLPIFFYENRVRGCGWGWMGEWECSACVPWVRQNKTVRQLKIRREAEGWKSWPEYN